MLLCCMRALDYPPMQPAAAFAHGEARRGAVKYLTEPLGGRRVAQRHKRKDELRRVEVRVPSAREQPTRQPQAASTISATSSSAPATTVKALGEGEALEEGRRTRGRRDTALSGRGGSGVALPASRTGART